MSEQKLTEGQRRVRLGFNPSGLKRVHTMKSLVASAIDYIVGMETKMKKNSDPTNVEDDDFFREMATAKTLLQQASSMAVGAATLGRAFDVFGSAQVGGELEIETGTYTKKPVSVDIITFDDFVEFGRKNAGSLNAEGYPLSFSYKDHPISHETNESYLIPTYEGILSFTKDDVLITGVKGEIYPCKIDIFKATYTK